MLIHFLTVKKILYLINENNLKKEELKIIGLLWSAVPLSDTKLFIKKMMVILYHLLHSFSNKR
jgi:hypothetical protein